MPMHLPARSRAILRGRDWPDRRVFVRQQIEAIIEDLAAVQRFRSSDDRGEFAIGIMVEIAEV
jgi:hypothetical protein